MDIKMIIAALFIKQKLVTVLLFNNNETGSSTGISIQCTYVRNNEKILSNVRIFFIGVLIK